jgi:CrtC N-terminal lipocalin domain
LTPIAGAGDFTVNAWGTTDADFARVGIERDTLAVWEDRFRTAEFVADPRSYEWWYFDLIGEDGAIVVFVILTRASLYVPGDVPARPAIALDVTPPGQQTRSYFQEFDLPALEASRERCDVTLDSLHVEGDLATYTISGEADGLGLDLSLTRSIASYRPGNGHIVFGDSDKYFAWFVPIPLGAAEGTIMLDGQQVPIAGEVYHDHNWGNARIPEGFARWWWGRGVAEDYGTIGVDITMRPRFASTSNLRPHPDPERGGEIANTLEYAYADGADTASLTFNTEAMLGSSDETTGIADANRAAMQDLGITRIWYTRFQAAPELTNLQPVRLGNPAAAALPRVFILCTADKNLEADPQTDSLVLAAERARSDPNWTVIEMDDNHMVNLNDPRATAEALMSLV